MKISGRTLFITGLFVGHFVISPITDGRARKIYEKFSSKKENLDVDFKDLDRKNKDFFIEKYGRTDGEKYYNMFNNQLIEGKLEEAVIKYESNKSNDNNRSNQMNPNNEIYWKGRGHEEKENRNNENYEYSKQELDNHSNQMNPNNDAYQSSRGK